MDTLLEPAMNSPQFLPTAVGIAVLSCLWLISQTAQNRRAGFLSAVAVPAGLAGFAVTSFPEFPYKLFPVAALGNFTLIVVFFAGFVINRHAAFVDENGERDGGRSIWPLLIWGVGMLMLPVIAVLKMYALWDSPDTNPDKYAPMVAWYGAAALAGQALGWALWLPFDRPSPEPVRSRMFLRFILLAGAVAGYTWFFQREWIDQLRELIESKSGKIE